METININGKQFSVLEDRIAICDKAPQDCTMEEVLNELHRVAELYKEDYTTLKISVTNCINQLSQHRKLVEKMRETTELQQRIELLPELEVSLKKLDVLVKANHKVVHMNDQTGEQLQTLGRFAKHVPVRTPSDAIAALKMVSVLRDIHDIQKKRLNCVLALHDVSSEVSSLSLSNS